MKQLGHQFLGGCVLALVSAGCVDNPRSPEPANQSPGPQAIYSRQELHFKNVRLWKPSVTEGGLEFTYAPLIIQEVSAHSRGPEPLLVSYFMDTVSGTKLTRDAADAQPLPRIAYIWQVEGATAKKQGIRVTLDSKSLPMLWESLTDSSGRQVVYASMAIEKAAAEKHGRPLPGRRYSIEPPTDAAPDLIVARVLEDGPVPMGPIVYLAGTNSDVATVICRCMPSQADEVVETLQYELAPVTDTVWPLDEPVLRLRWPER